MTPDAERGRNMTNETKEDRKGMAVKTRPLGFSDLREEGERVMDALLAPWRPFRVLAGELVGPALDVYEEGESLHVEVELPGLNDEDVEIRASADTLTVRCDKRAPEAARERDYYRRERGYGSFVRHIGLPAGADAEHATASFKDGVLHISIPLAGEPGTTRIEIASAGEA